MQQHAMCNNELKSHNGISVSVFVFSIETLRSALLYWSMIGLRCYWSALLLVCAATVRAATVRAATVRAATVPFALLLALLLALDIQ